MNKDHIKGVIELRAKLEHLFFKDFIREYEKPDGINTTHVMAMMILAHRTQLPMNELSYKLNLEKGSFTTVAARLCKEGYVKKERNLEDKRVYELSLTESGIDFTEQFKKEHHAYIDAKLKDLENQDDFFRLISQINQQLDIILK